MEKVAGFFTQSVGAAFDKLPHVVIGAPVRSRAWILDHFFYYLYHLVYPKEKITLYFIENDSNDSTLQILEDFAKKYGSLYERVCVDKATLSAPPDNRTHNIRERFVYRNLAQLRNRVVDWFLASGSDSLCFLDTDVMVTPFSLYILASQKKEAVSAWIANDAGRGVIGNVMRFVSPSAAQHIVGLPFSYTPFQADVTGAYFLLSKKCFEGTVPRFDFHIQGEDIPFCIALKNKGIQPYSIKADLAIHRMR